MSLIEINSLVKEYESGNEKVLAVNDITTKIGQGEFVTLMGESGSGKSTLLSILGGLNHPTSGNVIADEIDIFKLSANRIAAYRREYIGFVFQSYQLLTYLTVAENVLIPLSIGELSHNHQIERMKDALQKVHLYEKMDRLINELSGGEQQRVAIARAIVNDPLIILADEPTGNLDSRNGGEVMSLLSKLNDTGKTIVMVTHSKEFERYSNRSVYLKDGRLIN